MTMSHKGQHLCLSPSPWTGCPFHKFASTSWNLFWLVTPGWFGEGYYPLKLKRSLQHSPINVRYATKAEIQIHISSFTFVSQNYEVKMNKFLQTLFLHVMWANFYVECKFKISTFGSVVIEIIPPQHFHFIEKRNSTILTRSQKNVSFICDKDTSSLKCAGWFIN